MRARALVLLVSVGLTLLVAQPPVRAADPLQVGVGRADLTSPTGYYMQGWVRSDAVLEGVHTRIQARAIVLRRGTQKLALVAVDLNSVAGGVVAAAAARLAGRGFDDSNIIVSASHTHAAPSGYFTYPTYNTVFMTTGTPTAQNVTGALDPQLYAFEVRQLVEAITRADDDLAPGTVGWGSTQLTGLTQNRSLEAHLRNHGIVKEFGQGAVADDPAGYLHTISPEVQVLRVDKTGVGTIGLWSTFADHGTVNKYQFGLYNADHHGSATRVVEDELRRVGAVPAGQDVVNAYGNTDEGDQSAGLTRSGPAAADEVGRIEAAAMLTAWRLAGTRMTGTPALRTRFTRLCFCGQQTAGGPVSDTATPGLPLFTGSEEGRGPLHDVTQQPFEGQASPVDYPLDPAQGHKIVVPTGLTGDGSTPPAVPVTVAQVGERLIATVPGEMSVDMARRVRGGISLLAQGQGITGVQLSGLANEYLSYFVTPEEYDAQHYEGGSQMYGREASVALQESLLLLTKALVDGTAAPAPDLTDPRNGVVDTAAPFGTGARAATPTTQPGTTQRFQRAEFAWQGGEKGLDMPLGRALVSVERLDRTGRWLRVTDDLGLQIAWRVSNSGVYSAQWEVPRDASPGSFRFTVSANHYRLASAPFTVTPATTLSVDQGVVRYPDPVVNVDLTYRPRQADGGRIARRTGEVVPAGGAVDRYGNCNGAAATVGTRSGADRLADPAVCGQRVVAPRPVTPAGPPGQSGGGALAATGPAPWLPVLALLLLGTGLSVVRREGRSTR